MKDKYVFEPSKKEIILTEIIGNTIIKPYYIRYVKKIKINSKDKVLDYCSGSGIITKIISKYAKEGRVVYADVSNKWLTHIKNKIKYAQGVKINCFDEKIAGGDFDKVLIHFSLHDFPCEYRPQVIKQVINNMKSKGILYIREPINIEHGIALHELVNLLEHDKRVNYSYEVNKSVFIGQYVDVYVTLKSK